MYILLVPIIFGNFFTIHALELGVFPTDPRFPPPGVPTAPGSPWPLPQEWKSEDQLVSIGLRRDFGFKVNVGNCEPLKWAFQRFNYRFIFGTKASPDYSLPILNKVSIQLPTDSKENECNSKPRFEADKSHEAYELSITATGNVASALISAKTVWGALRGIETFSQLVFDEPDGQHFYANVTKISDWPRFPHRGVMLDSSRHYLPERLLLQVLDALFQNKFNVFHWHVVDDQSFPFVSQRFPDLSAKGAFHEKAVYSPATVKRILEAARMRGIRVIFEFDTPGHTHSWGNAYPELLTPCYGDGVTPGTANQPHHGAYENLDPTNEFTYELTKEFFAEVTQVAYDDHIHLGMDEVYPGCWNSSPVIKDFMKEHGYEDLHEVQGHYSKRHLKNVLALGAKPIIWQDPLDDGVEFHEDIIVQMWKDFGLGWKNYTQKYLDAGYRVLVSSPWYLNYISYGETWKKYYENDPVLDLPHITPEQVDRVLGGEAAIWSEFVDKTNLIPRLFPFAGAVGERLWSRANSSTADEAMIRLYQHRCRMLRRGIPAQPIWNGYCGSWEFE